MAAVQRIKSHCDHCGNLTFKLLICDETIEKDEETAVEQSVYRCQICDNLILFREIYDPRPIRLGESEPESRKLKREQLWPTPLTLPAEVPDRVREIYEEARAVRHSPSSFVVQIGRALEALVRDRNAQGKTLYQRLEWLVNQGYLPRVLGEMAHLNRIIRNWGAHDADITLASEDVVIVDEFFRAIVEYIYIAPSKVNRVTELVRARQGA